MIGFNFDLNTLKNEWKSICVGVFTNCFFWYMIFYIFNRDIITNNPFYIPMILTVPLSIISYYIGYFFSIPIFLLSKLNKIVEAEVYPEKRFEVNLNEIVSKEGMYWSILLMCLFVIKHLYSITIKDFKLTVFYFLFYSAIVSSVFFLIMLLWILYKIKKLRKKTIK